MLLPRVAGHALQEEQPGLLVEDGVGGAACVARHKLLQNRDPDLFFTITNSTTVSGGVTRALCVNHCSTQINNFIGKQGKRYFSITELCKNIPAKLQKSLSKCSAAHPKPALCRNISASHSRNLAGMF